MTLRKPALCYACKRLERDFDNGLVCSAFPEGIPAQILDGFDHRRPFPGDGGTRFVRDPDQPLPDGFPEEGPTAEGGVFVTEGGVFVTEPASIRTQTDKELRDSAKAMIERFRQHPDRG